MDPSGEFVLEMRGIAKCLPGVVALVGALIMDATGVEWADRILHGENPPPEIAVPIELVK